MHRRGTIAFLVLGLTIAGPAGGQTAQPPDGPPNPVSTPPAPPPAPIDGLDAAPFVAENLGYSQRLPAVSIIERTMVDGKPLIIITEGAAAPRWRFRIQRLTSTLRDPSPANQIDDHLARLRSGGREFTQVAREPLTLAGANGEMLLLEQPDAARSINGFLILPRGSREFIVVTIFTTREHYDTVMPVLRRSFGTVSVTPFEEHLRLQAARVDRGRDIVDGFSPELLRGLVTADRTWYRVYRPGADGTELDIGYFSIRCAEGMRGELDQRANPARLSGGRADKGLLVILEAHAIVDPTVGQTVDVHSRFWLSWDRGEGGWSTLTTLRQGELAQTLAETGVRSRAEPRYPHGTLTVIRSDSQVNTPTEPAQWAVPDQAYISPGELLVLGSLLPRDGSISEPFDFYAYDSSSASMPRHRATWTPAPDASGHWDLKLEPLNEQLPYTVRFDRAGQRFRRTDLDGTVTERIDVTVLRRIWKRARLGIR